MQKRIPGQIHLDFLLIFSQIWFRIYSNETIYIQSFILWALNSPSAFSVGEYRGSAVGERVLNPLRFLQLTRGTFTLLLCVPREGNIGEVAQGGGVQTPLCFLQTARQYI